MANEKVRFKYGSKVQLLGNGTTIPALAKTPGTVYFAIDGDATNGYDGYLYFDKDTSTRILFGRRAEFATYDDEDNDIAGTYVAGVSFTAAANKVTSNFTNGKNQTSSVDFPNASFTAAGAITAQAQTLGGTKTFGTGITIQSPNSTKAMFNYADIQLGTSDAARPIWFAWSGQNGTPVYDNDFTYNPATNTLTVAHITGSIEQATKDGEGQIIAETYVAKVQPILATASGLANTASQLKVTWGDDTNTTYTIVTNTIRRWT